MMASASRLLTVVAAISLWSASEVTSASNRDRSDGIPYELFLSQPSVSALQETGKTPRPFTHTRTGQSGRYITFHSASSFLVPGDVNGAPDVFLRDRLLDSIELLSRDRDGNAGGGDSSFPDISADGRYVVFHSRAGDLLDEGHDGSSSTDGNDNWDVFLLDRQDDEISLVSHAPDGTAGDGESFTGTVSDDGRYVAFTSWADNLTSDPAEAFARIYVADMVAGTVSLLVDSPTGGFGGSSFVPDISGDGRYVAFESISDKLDPDDTNGNWDIYTFDRGATTTATTSSVDGDSGSDTHSDTDSDTDTDTHSDSDSDGDDTASTGSLVWVSRGAGDSVGSFRPRISNDGDWIAFESYSDLLVTGDVNGVVDIFRWGRSDGAIVRVSNSDPGDAIGLGATSASISGDGTVVAFHTDSDHEVSGDDNGKRDTYVVDLANGTITWSSDPTKTGGALNDPSHPSITDDGAVIAFESRIPKGHADKEDDDDWDPYVADLAGGSVSSVVDQAGPRTPTDAYLFDRSGASRFGDVEPVNFYDSGVGFLAVNGISEGVEPGRFGPGESLTRAELVVLLHRLNGTPSGSPISAFVDVPPMSWHSSGVAWASRVGVTTGVGLDRFRPNEPASRAQIVVMLHRLAGAGSGDSTPTPFVDVARGSWYSDAVDWAFATGITTGVSPDRFGPHEAVSRGQAAAFIERFARLSGWVPSR